ncbi:MAG: DUF4389 domain-containing protein [Dehalococcoidia bacterium]
MQDASSFATPPPYPVRLSIDYPEKLSRLSTFFRVILAIPVLIFLGLLGGTTFEWFSRSEGVRNISIGGAGGLIAAIWATILVRGSIPRWIFDFQVAVHRFTYRAFAYLGLLTDKYPAFEGDWVVQYDVDYPGRLSRWRILFWKLITSLPHFFVLLFLGIAALFVTVIAWFAILFTGNYPRGLHSFVAGTMRWGARVSAYFESLTDVFPPFSLDDDAGPAAPGTQTLCAVIGSIVFALMVAGAIGLGTFLLIYLNQSEREHVDYRAALGADLGADASIEMDDVTFTLRGGDDPATFDLLSAAPGHRLVAFRLRYESEQNRFTIDDDRDGFDSEIEDDAVRIKTEDEGTVKPVLLTFEGAVAPVDIASGATGELVAIFEIGQADTIEELRAYPNEGGNRRVVWDFD